MLDVSAFDTMKPHFFEIYLNSNFIDLYLYLIILLFI